MKLHQHKGLKLTQIIILGDASNFSDFLTKLLFRDFLFLGQMGLATIRFFKFYGKMEA